MKRLQRLCLNHKKGLTLAELIVALAVIPGLLLAASVFYTHVARAMQETTDRGNAMTQREQIINMLQRYIANGNDATATGGSYPEGGNTLTVTIPDNSDLIYEFVKSSSFDAETPAKLFMSNDGGATMEPINFSGTADMKKYAGYISEQGSGVAPFIYNSSTKTVTVKLQFHVLPIDPPQCASDSTFPNCPSNISFDVKLRGGDVAP